MTIRNYVTGSSVEGTASEELETRSAAEEPTGAVPAYRDEAGVWQYVQPSLVDHMRGLGHDVITVYVD